MLKIALMLHAVTATALMGIAVTFVLAMQMDGSRPIIAAVAIGFLAAIPVSWLVARQIVGVQSDN